MTDSTIHKGGWDGSSQPARATVFEKITLDYLPPRPDWWLVRPDEITTIVRGAARGVVKKIATTPLGYPVWTLTYGGQPPAPGTATWVSASASQNWKAYKTGDDEMQTVVIACGIHGAEPEAVIGSLNLISLLETGLDLRGKPRQGLVKLAESYRLIILPCVNMDGRSVSPDHLNGVTPHDFRRVSQGWRKDGSLIGYPGCKEYAPLHREDVAHFGGYPNSDGYNIMHDCEPSGIRTAEAAALLRVIADEQADLLLNCHSHEFPPMLIGASAITYPAHRQRISDYRRRVFDALQAAGLRPKPVEERKPGTALNIDTAAMMASGALTATFEQPAVAGWSFDDVVDTFYTFVETFLEWGIKEPFAQRDKLAD
ncbi:MAG: M14 family zinc carboxypeptidase [Planctomycetota bacterium]